MHKCDVDQESLDVALRQLALTDENLKQFLAAPQASPQANLALRSAPCKLGNIIDEVVGLIEPSLRHRRVNLSIVGAPDTCDQLNADRGHLRQLLMNLVLNAADAAGPGGWVRVETASPRVDAADSETPSPRGRGQVATGDSTWRVGGRTANRLNHHPPRRRQRPRPAARNHRAPVRTVCHQQTGRYRTGVGGGAANRRIARRPHCVPTLRRRNLF